MSTEEEGGGLGVVSEEEKPALVVDGKRFAGEFKAEFVFHFLIILSFFPFIYLFTSPPHPPFFFFFFLSRIFRFVEKTFVRDEGARKKFSEWMFRLADMGHNNRVTAQELKRILDAIGRDGIKLDEFHEAGQVRGRGGGLEKGEGGGRGRLEKGEGGGGEGWRRGRGEGRGDNRELMRLFFS